MDSEKQQELIEYLNKQDVRELQWMARNLEALEEHVPNPRMGICFHLGDADEIFIHIATFWPKFSGDRNYPIPGGREAYDYISSEEDKPFKWSRGQLKFRHELMDFVIYEVNQFLETPRFPAPNF